MAFKTNKRSGKHWEDVETLHEMVLRYPFHTTGKKERDFENGFASSLLVVEERFNGKINTQIDKTRRVPSVQCFGKKHRPDATVGADAIAIELKYIKGSGFRDAIGQGLLYRLDFRFVFLVLIISEHRRSTYQQICDGEDSHYENLVQYLADKHNVFIYAVPAFESTEGCQHFHEIIVKKKDAPPRKEDTGKGFKFWR